MPALRSAALLSLALLGACASPVLPPPPAPAPAAFQQTGLWQRAGTAPTGELSADWWRVFDDPVLDQLQAQLVIGNENLKAAVAQVDQARAVLGGSQAAQQPTLGATASASRSDSGVASLSRQPQNAFSLGLSAAWELDLWGRLAEATRANQARYAASQADLAAARRSAQATLAQTYFALRTAELQSAVLARSVAAYQRAVELTQVRQQAGVASPADVLQARTQLETAQVQAIDVENQRAQYEHAVAVLLGLPPAGLRVARTEGEPTLPAAPAVPAFVPSTLLQRRPDIAAAQQRVMAAYAAIGVADAAFFPSLTLSAAGGLRSSSLDELLRAPSLFWSLGPALAHKLFDGGALEAASAQARAGAEQAAATYRQTVLIAFQETEDNLLLADRVQAQAALQREALQHAQRALEITLEQYRVGTVSYLNVVSAQTTALAAERTLLDLQLKQLGAVIRLMKDSAPA
jgi:NodT family efflux transporter outer membrane factor (OMF) lipoprotein